MIRFACPACNAALELPENQAGLTVNCSTCGRSMLVPVATDRTKRADEKFCLECGAIIRAKAVVCPKCGVEQRSPTETSDDRDEVPNTNRVAAGILAILLGALGIHKFILGYTTAGITMLLVTLLTCGVAGIVMHVIGIVEGIIYLSKSEREFYQTYVLHEKTWF